MIRVTIAPEPADFNDKVRMPGEHALALLAGKPPPHPRKGRPIQAYKTVRGQRVPKTVDDFPYWRACLDALHAAYRGICAYYAFRTEKATLPQVDHFVAKSDPGQDLAYEWSNYRLACGQANACKREHSDVLDPATIEDGWFQLDLMTLAVRADPALPVDLRKRIDDTITRLQLSLGRAREMRQHAMAHFRSGRVLFAFLEMDHPFLARELARQGVLNKAQLPELPAAVVDRVEPEL